MNVTTQNPTISSNQLAATQHLDDTKVNTGKTAYQRTVTKTDNKSFINKVASVILSPFKFVYNLLARVVKVIYSGITDLYNKVTGKKTEEKNLDAIGASDNKNLTTASIPMDGEKKHDATDNTVDLKNQNHDATNNPKNEAELTSVDSSESEKASAQGITTITSIEKNKISKKDVDLLLKIVTKLKIANKNLKTKCEEAECAKKEQEEIQLEVIKAQQALKKQIPTSQESYLASQKLHEAEQKLNAAKQQTENKNQAVITVKIEADTLMIEHMEIALKILMPEIGECQSLNGGNIEDIEGQFTDYLNKILIKKELIAILKQKIEKPEELGGKSQASIELEWYRLQLTLAEMDLNLFCRILSMQFYEGTLEELESQPKTQQTEDMEKQYEDLQYLLNRDKKEYINVCSSTVNNKSAEIVNVYKNIEDIQEKVIRARKEDKKEVLLQEKQNLSQAVSNAEETCNQFLKIFSSDKTKDIKNLLNSEAQLFDNHAEILNNLNNDIENAKNAISAIKKVAAELDAENTITTA